MKKGLLIVLLTGVMFGTNACKKGDSTQDTGGGSTGTEKGYASGKVVDSQNKPIAGVKIYVDNTIFFNSGMSTTTDANGNYKIKVTQGSWKTYAVLTRQYLAQTYELYLHPDNATSFSGDGAVRNFTWKLTGENVLNPGSYYGGRVVLGKNPNSDLFDSQNIEFTFTPLGELIDGTVGSVLKLRGGQPGSDNYNVIQDVPFGKYRVTAVYTPTNTPLKVMDESPSGNGSYAESVEIFFQGKNSWRAPYTMYLGYSD